MDTEQTEIRHLREMVAELRSENSTLKGAMDAQDERERIAGEKCGVTDCGCDWPDWVAERVLHLRAEAERLKAERDGLRVRYARALHSPELAFYTDEQWGRYLGLDATRKAGEEPR